MKEFTINGITVRITRAEDGYKATTQNAYQICTVDYFKTEKEVQDYIALCEMVFSSFSFPGKGRSNNS